MKQKKTTIGKSYNDRKFLRFFIAFIIACLLAMPHLTWANDFGSAFKAAQSSFPPLPIFGGMGGVWVAVPYPASENPACAAFFLEKQKKFSFYTNPNWIHFNNGPETRVLINALMFPFLGGCFKLSYVDINSQNFCQFKLYSTVKSNIIINTPWNKNLIIYLIHSGIISFKSLSVKNFLRFSSKIFKIQKHFSIFLR